MNELPLFDLPLNIRFDGVTVEARDVPRLGRQLAGVKELMSDGQWRTLAQIHAIVGGSEAGVSARLRDLRKKRNGSYIVNRRRVVGGLFEYQVL